MSLIRSGGLPPAYVRDERMKNVADELGRASDVSLKKAGVAIDEAGGHAASAALAGASATVNVAEAGFDAGKAITNTAKGVGAAVVGGVAKAAAVVSDALGAALQWLGKGLIKLGNKARETSGLGGGQVTTRTILGDPKAEHFADRMFKLSGDAFDLAGKQWVSSVDHLISAGGDLKDCATCVAAAAEKTLEAAVLVGDAGALKLAQGSVEVARRALWAAEQGVDTAGELLQNAGRQVIAAGNAVNTARGNDTGIR